MELLTLDLLRHALLYLLVPAWLLVGLADYLCHRAQHIEETAGLHESLLHLAMIAALAGGVCTALFFEMNAATLWILLGACVLHEVIMLADLHWADESRGIPWYEQWVHGMQQAIPWMGLAAVMLLHPTQTLAMFGLGDMVAEWQLVWKRTPLPEGYVPTFIAAGALLVGLPFLEEAGRCVRVRMQRRREVPAWKVR
jgi:hypothetical protein